MSGQCVHSHNYPGSYANHENCTLQPVHGQPLRVQAFDTEEGYDFLTINGVGYSGSGGTDEHGNNIPEDIVPDREITWSSDAAVGRSSWNRVRVRFDERVFIHKTRRAAICAHLAPNR